MLAAVVVPRLSVTITNYNYGRFLAQSIESVLGQSFADFELILIDNASQDDSVEIMRRYQQCDPRIELIVHDVNQGMFASLEESVNRSRGLYRVQIDADDWVLSPDAFEAQVGMLDAHPEMAFVYSALTQIGSDGVVHHVSRPFAGDVVLPGEDAVEQVLRFSLNDTGTMLRVAAYRAAGGYPPTSPHISDTQLCARMCAVGSVGYIDRSLYAFRQHGDNLHFRHQTPVVRDEILPMIDEVFAGPLAARMADPVATKRRVVRNALVHLPTVYIFGGAPLTGWRMYWESVKLRPLDTVLQPRTLSLLARTLLGHKAFSWLRRRLSGDSSPAPTTTVAAMGGDEWR
jgi:glycosyltransferase involved in cell wall biosynthesis